MQRYNLSFKITPHLERLAKQSEAIRRQFYPLPEEGKLLGKSRDPLKEKSRTPIKGLIHRYSNRALILLTLDCAAYCRFCFRRRTKKEIEAGDLTIDDIKNIIHYLKKHSEINEIIISGGDPLIKPKLLKQLLKSLLTLKQIRVIRIGTRLPISDPLKINNDLVKILSLIKKPALYILIHINHPDELTSQTKKAIKKLQQTKAILLSQTVFLKGINDEVKTLATLFEELLALKIKPYYLFHNDEPLGTKHFTVSFKKEIKIMTALRKRISGLACPMYVYDDPDSRCKIPLPLDFDYSFMKKKKQL